MSRPGTECRGVAASPKTTKREATTTASWGACPSPSRYRRLLVLLMGGAPAEFEGAARSADGGGARRDSEQIIFGDAETPE